MTQPAANPEQLLEALDPDQREVATHLRGPLCVLAGAGTGKTRAITYRIAYGVATGEYLPASVLALSFTSRAAGEMRSRLGALGVSKVQARTFHSAALRQLTHFWSSAVGGQRPALQEYKAPLVAAAASRMGLATDKTTIRDLASEVEWSKVSLVGPQDYPDALRAAGREAPAGLEPGRVSQLLELYEIVKHERNVLDFEDVLLVLKGILLEREDILRTIQNQYSVFVVDEYQDVSPLQQSLLDSWLGKRRDLCVVGDVAQTIYSFTGASPRYLTGFARRYPGAHTISLVRDYRSTPQVVSLANTVLEKNGAGARLPGAVKLVAQRPSSVPVEFEVYGDDAAEASGIAARISDLAAKGIPLSEIAILYRTNAQSQAFEDALSAAGIGYVVHGGVRFFARPEVREAMVLLRSNEATNTEDLPTAVREVLSGMGWSTAPPAARGAVRERWESLRALDELAAELHEQRGMGLAGFNTELAERANAQHAPTVEGVTLASLHAAKGLEWDAVFLAGLSDGLLPISLAELPEAVEEERRLLYVGITRAREHLQLSYAKARHSGGRGSRKPSRFLTGIWPSDVTPQRSGRAASRERRERFSLEADAATLVLFEELVEWRAAQAREQGKPAYTIFHDATLQDLATRKPQTLDELARVRGIGETKLHRYGPQLLQICASR